MSTLFSKIMRSLFTSKSLPPAKSRRRSNPLRLEALEARFCPDCSITQTGTLLTILGDRMDNRIDITQTSDSIQVACDGGESQSFRGVQHIRVNTWAGNDAVTAHLTPGPDDDLTVRVDLGAGDDTFTATFNPTESISPAGRMQFDALGGLGNDALSLTIGDHDGPHLLNSDVAVNFYGGAGTDNVVIAIIDVALNGDMGIGVDSGSGVDTVGFTIHGGTVAAGASLMIDANGGAGDDMMQSWWANTTFNGSTTVNLNGDDGADRIAVQVENPIFQGPASLNVTSDGGKGNDFIDVAQVDPTGDLYGADRAHSNMMIAGGDGQDVIHLLVGNINQTPDLELRLDWNIAVTGGGGSDDMDLEARNLLLVGDPADPAAMTFQLRFDGDDGADRLAVHVGNPIFQGSANLNVTSDGGKGNDFIDVANVDPTGDLYGADRAHSNIMVAGGGGQDVIHLLVGNINQTPDPELRLDWIIALTGNEGSDTIDVQAINLLLTADPAIGDQNIFNLDGDGGGGRDAIVIDVIGGTVARDALLGIDMHGGDDSDVLRLSTSGLVVETGGQFMSCQEGNGGNDVLDLSLSAYGTGVYDVEMLGDAGNDTLVADLAFRADFLGSLDFLLDAGVGDDRLTAFLPFIEQRPGTRIRIDGGAGRDIAYINRNLLPFVTNCEEIVVLG